jgi:hypothetical protein
LTHAGEIRHEPTAEAISQSKAAKKGTK